MMEAESWYLDNQADSVYTNADIIVLAMAVADDEHVSEATAAGDEGESPGGSGGGYPEVDSEADMFPRYWIADTYMEQEW